ncbi:hypothetical protein M1247_14070 [Mycobacterium sp. 21AC1]|nr:hypothetical protein [Mycobacterium sp. 21AC1]
MRPATGSVGNPARRCSAVNDRSEPTADSVNAAAAVSANPSAADTVRAT